MFQCVNWFRLLVYWEAGGPGSTQTPAVSGPPLTPDVRSVVFKGKACWPVVAHVFGGPEVIPFHV